MGRLETVEKDSKQKIETLNKRIDTLEKENQNLKKENSMLNLELKEESKKKKALKILIRKNKTKER